MDTPPHKKIWIARSLVLTSVIIWGWTFVASKVCLGFFSPIEIVGLRFGIGLPILALVMLFKRTRFTIDPPDLFRVAAGATIIAVHFLVQVWALKFTTATNTGWIIAVCPLAMSVLAWLFLKEHLRRNELIGILCATFGIALLISKGDFVSTVWLQSFGDWLILFSAFTWALYTVVTRDLSRKYPAMTVTLWVFAPVALVCLVLMYFSSDWSRFLHVPWKPLVGLLFLAIPGTLAQWFWQEAVAVLGASRAGIWLYLEPIATMLLAVIAIHEPIYAITLLGGLIVLMSVWWAQRK